MGRIAARAPFEGGPSEDGIARAHAPNGMLSVKNCVHAAAPAKPTSVATPMAPPVGLTGNLGHDSSDAARAGSCNGGARASYLLASHGCAARFF